MSQPNKTSSANTDLEPDKVDAQSPAVTPEARELVQEETEVVEETRDEVDSTLVEAPAPKFAKGDFGPDKANRLKRGPIDFDKDSPNVPPEVREAAQAYSNVVHDTRSMLSSVLKPGSSPEVPRELHSADHFFDEARSAANRAWRVTAGPKLAADAKEWIASLKQKAAEDPEKAESIDAIIKVLENPSDLEDKIRIRQLGVLEGLRGVDFVLWEKILALTSEYQHTELRITQNWVRQLDEKALENLNVKREELQLVTRMQNFTNHFINVAYLKQMEKAEQEGGTEASPLGSTLGADRLYEIAPWEGEGAQEEAAEAGTYKPQTYGEAFPLELQRVSKNLQRLAETTDKWLADKKLPEKYAGLPAHLRLMSEAYSSPESRPSAVAALWDRVVESGYDLARTGCPVILIPPNTPSVAGDASKVDVEARVAVSFNPPEGLEQIFGDMEEQVKKFNADHQSLLSAEHDKPKIALYALPNGGAGPNLFYETPAESGGVVWLHYNSTANVAVSDQLPYLRGMMANEEIDTQDFVQGSYVENGIHEVGHTRIPSYDESTIARIGEGNEKEVIEELKAETQGMRTFLEVHTEKNREISPEAARRTMLAKLGVQFDAIANKTNDAGSFGERYHMPGVFISKALLKSGVLVYDEATDTYAIKDYRRGLDEVAKIGDMLAERFYANPNCTPADVEKFVNEEVRPLSDDPEIRRLKEKLGMARERAAKKL